MLGLIFVATALVMLSKADELSLYAHFIYLLMFWLGILLIMLDF